MNSDLSWLHEEGVHERKLRLKLLRAAEVRLETFAEAETRLLAGYRANGRSRAPAWAIANTLLDTGCRIDEALDIGPADVDLENLLVTLRGTGSKERKVPMSLELRQMLFRHMRRLPCFLSGSRDCRALRFSAE